MYNLLRARTCAQENNLLFEIHQVSNLQYHLHHSGNHLHPNINNQCVINLIISIQTCQFMSLRFRAKDEVVLKYTTYSGKPPPLTTSFCSSSLQTFQATCGCTFKPSGKGVRYNVKSPLFFGSSYTNVNMICVVLVIIIVQSFPHQL